MSDRVPFTGDPGLVLGDTPGEHRIEEAVEAADAALALVRQARQSLRIFTRDLDPTLYSSEAFRDAVAGFARRGRHTEARILVQDPTRAIRTHHRLIDLAQMLSSHIGVRRVAAEWADEVCALLLADERGLLYRPYGDRFEGSVDFAAGPRALELGRWFDDVWENSLPDPEFRQLKI